jgi:pimeloyl-ACP methyl ester carboxylesterase
LGFAVGKLPEPRGWRRFIRRWLFRFVGGYLLVVFIMWLLENRLVFLPTKAADGWNPPPDAAIQDVFFTSPAGRKIHAWHLPAGPDRPVLLVFPGNGGNLSGRSSILLDAKRRLGVAAMVFDYPGYGKSEGSPNEENCYDAAEGAVRWLRDEQGVSPERVIFFGESLGGGVAAELARRHPCRALVLKRSFTSLPATAKRHYPWLPVGWLMSNRFDTIAKLPEIHSPVFITSATADTVVPYEHGEILLRAANEPKRFFRDDGAEHNDSLPDAFWTELRTFLALPEPAQHP